MEAENSHDLPSANWKPRKFQSKSKSLRTRSAEGVSPSPAAGEVLRLSLGSQEERANSIFLHFVVLFAPSTGWMMPPALGRTIYFT